MDILSDMEQQAFQAIQRIFPCEEKLLDKIPLDEIISTFQDDLIVCENLF